MKSMKNMDKFHGKCRIKLGNIFVRLSYWKSFKTRLPRDASQFFGRFVHGKARKPQQYGMYCKNLGQSHGAKMPKGCRGIL